MKKQMKKGLSLIMAVLMVMSCWVWIAPTKAEAAGSQYYVKFMSNVDDTGRETQSKITIKYKKNNGTGDEVSTVVRDVSSKVDWEGETVLYEGYIDGFPTSVSFFMKMYYSSGTEHHANFRFYVGKDKDHCTTNLINNSDSSQSWEFKGKDGSTYTPDSTHWVSSQNPKPTTSNFTDNAVTLNIPAVGSGVTNTTAIQKPVILDQYGVEWADTPTFNLAPSKGSSKDESPEDGYLKFTQSGAGISSGATVSVTEAFQVNNPLSNSNDTYKDWYLGATVEGNGTYTFSQKIRLVYPTYTLTFNADYNTSLSDGATKLTLKDGSTYTGGITSEGRAYGQSFTTYPTDATKEGYEFLGFFTVQQPSTGNQSPYALKSQFQEPLTTAEYNRISDESLKSHYCDAGDKFDPKNTDYTTCLGNKTYYAWFIAKDVSVKFFTIGGKYIKEVTTKYGKTGADVGFPVEGTDFPAQYQSGPFSYDNYTGKWVNVGGDVIEDTTRLTKDAYILTPQYSSVTYDNSYTVTFYKGTGDNAETKTYTYRQNCEPGKIAATIQSTYSNQYTYSFVGWTTVKPTGAEAKNNRHFIREDADVTFEGTLITFPEDFLVRDDVTYYPVYRAQTKSYEVTFTYVNSAATFTTETKTFKYGEYLSAPSGIPSAYATQGKEYKFEGWFNVDRGDTPNINYVQCTGAAAYTAYYDNGTEKPYTITFIYKNDKGEDVTKEEYVNHGEYLTSDAVAALTSAAKYDDGEQLWTFTNSWESETAGTFSQDNLNNFSPTGHTTFKAKYGDPKNFYKVTYVDGSNSETYRVVEGDVLPEWTVTKTVTEKDKDGKETTKEVKEAYVPSKASTDSGKYVFIGWADAEQTEEQILNGTVAGTKYEVGTSAITATTTLYAQYKFTQFTYTIEFVNYDGTSLAKGEFHYGDPLAAIKAEAEGKATKASDDTYHYEFIGWDKKVPDKCEGGEDGSVTTYKAQYRNRYNYYDVQWFNTDADGKVVNPDGTAPAEGETAKYIEKSTYTYGDRIYTPSESFTYPTGEGTAYVLSGWKYKDAEDNWQTFARNTVIDKSILSVLDEAAGTKGIKMYAVYKEATKYYTVKVIVPAAVEGETDKTYTYTVEHGKTIADLITDPADGYVDETYHQEFSGWVTKSKDATAGGIEGATEDKEFDVTTEITSDIEIYATFKKLEHKRDMQEVVTAPTYPMAAYTDWGDVAVGASDGKGVMLKWCACSKENTKDEEDIPALTDSVKPTATTYVGTTNWSDMASAYVSDVVYANPNTDLIITTSDKGDVNALYNPDGNGIGVQTIQLAIVEAETLAAAGAEGLMSLIISGEITFDTVYNWTEIQAQLIDNYGGWAKVPEKYKNYNANYSAKLDDFGLEDGKTYVAIYVITDKVSSVVTDEEGLPVAGNTSYAITGKFLYDETAPVITVNGASNAAKDTYCVEAKVTVNDTDAVVTDYDTPISKNADGVYVITTAGQHKIVATDKAGNKTTKYFVVNKDHNLDTYTQNPTCTADGHTSQRCTNCGYETDTTPIPALDHDYKDESIAATCTANGTKVEVCSRCGKSVTQTYKTDDSIEGDDKTVYEKNEDGSYKFGEDGKKIPVYLLPALGHSYDAGVVTLKASCVSTGILVKTCTRCGEKINETIAIDEDAHSYGSAYVVKASCTEDGYRKHACRYCAKIETIETLPATGHTEGEYYTVEDSTCTKLGYKYLQCAECGANCTDSLGNLKTEVIPMKDHFWVKDDANCKDPTTTSKGYVAFKCQNCDANKGYETDALVESTVTFIGEDDKELYKFTLVNGSGITQVDSEDALVEGAAMVVKPSKASTEKYEYTFMGWYAKNDKGEYTGSAYTLPMTVSKDLTLYARFSEKAIVKTLQFYAPTAYDRAEGNFTDDIKFKTLIGTVGDTKRLPAETPTLKSDDYNSFEFDYWQKSDGTKFDGTITDDATLTAVFKVVDKKYTVNFMNDNSNTAHETIEVAAGEGLTAEQIAAVAKPTKAKDDSYHYDFSGWYSKSGVTDSKYLVTSIDEVTDSVILYAGYTPVAHSQKADVKPVVTQKADCTKPEITEYTCSCGHTWSAQTAAAKGHTDGEVKYNEKTGENDIYCSVCGDVIRSENASYTVKFVNGASTIYNQSAERNSSIALQAKDLEAKATKASDDEFSYEFDGWTMDGDTSGTVYKSDELPLVTSNVTYYAHYKATTRVYTIIFATRDGKEVDTFKGVKYGTTIDENGNDYSKYEYSAVKFPAKEADSKVHYVFNGWDGDITKGATKDLAFRPTFKEVEHTWDSGYKTGATCETPGGTKFTCTVCGYWYINDHDGKEPALDHQWSYAVITEPTYDAEGLGRYTCQRPGCGKTKDEIIPCKQRLTITVTVKDTNGVVYEGAKVTITHKVSGKSYGPNLTNKEGVATFYVDEAGEYFVSILEIPGHEGGNSGDITIDENGKITDNTIPELKGDDHVDCSCGCHRNGFWGMLFRFFHKIIKLFAGRYICCDCPDSRY